MDTACVDYCLTEKERETFEQNGFLIVEDALPPQMVSDLTAAVDRLDAQYRAKDGLAAHDRLRIYGFLADDERFLEMIDWPRVFPKVWGILGWHIQLYFTHMDITPPSPPDEEPVKERLDWHKDTRRLTKDLGTTDLQSRISLKVAYFLSDTTEPGRGNFSIIPGTHLQNTVEFPPDEVSDPEGATPVCVPPGTAVIFDRRLFHARSPNYSEVTRKALFYGYSYRWLRSRVEVPAFHVMDRCDPVRQQLLGAGPSGLRGYTFPSDADVPLRDWIRDHLGEEAVAP